ANLQGGDGDDLLVNEATDICAMTGGQGDDTFSVRLSGQTTIYDWNNERINIQNPAWNDLAEVPNNPVGYLLENNARVQGNDIVITMDPGFDEPFVITIKDHTDISALEDYIFLYA
ncbi:unnamed protein product, partial [Ectocarpus sp. 12 AP-2014]